MNCGREAWPGLNHGREGWVSHGFEDGLGVRHRLEERDGWTGGIKPRGGLVDPGPTGPGPKGQRAQGPWGLARILAGSYASKCRAC